MQMAQMAKPHHRGERKGSETQELYEKNKEKTEATGDRWFHQGRRGQEGTE